MHSGLTVNCPQGGQSDERILIRRFFSFSHFHYRDEKFADSLARLKSDLIRANAIVKEANLISTSLNNGRPKINYDVTLQIPAANLRPSRIKVRHF